MINSDLPVAVTWTFEHIPGCRVIPCSGKKSMCKWKYAFKKDLNDARRLQNFLSKHPATMFGILTKPSKLVVIDCDVNKETHAEEGLENFRQILRTAGITELPQTFTVKSGSGGTHFYFWADRSDYKCCTGELAPLVDVKAGGKAGAREE